MDLRRLRWEEWLAAAFGAVLFASLFLPWYRAQVNRTDFTAWQAFGALDVLLAAVALIAIALAVMATIHPTAAVPIAMASMLTLSGLLATALTISRIVTPPDSTPHVIALGRGTAHNVSHTLSLRPGAWVGLAACALLTAVAVTAMRDEGYPQAVREATSLDIETRPAPPVEGGTQGAA